MINFVQYLNVPTRVALIIVSIFFITQIIGELLEFKGKVVPECIKIRKYFERKRKEKLEVKQTLKEVKKLLDDRIQLYDNSIVEINNKLSVVKDALKDTTKITEEIFVQSSRDRIIDFAARVVDEKSVMSRESFNRIFKAYNKYESFLEERHLTNGEVDVAIQIIKEAYENHMKEHTFIEDVRGYIK